MADTVTDLKTGQVRMFFYGEDVADEMDNQEGGFEIDDTVNIPRSEYLELLEDSEFLACLEILGVENWEGFEAAQALFEEEDEEDD